MNAQRRNYSMPNRPGPNRQVLKSSGALCCVASKQTLFAQSPLPVSLRSVATSGKDIPVRSSSQLRSFKSSLLAGEDISSLCFVLILRNFIRFFLKPHASLPALAPAIPGYDLNSKERGFPLTVNRAQSLRTGSKWLTPFGRRLAPPVSKQLLAEAVIRKVLDIL